jgi:hypothetical protein
MVRPDRFELPTFWFVAMQHLPILLILLSAKAAFEANKWRTKAAVDEGLMKGSEYPFERILLQSPGVRSS